MDENMHYDYNLAILITIFLGSRVVLPLENIGRNGLNGYSLVVNSIEMSVIVDTLTTNLTRLGCTAR